MLPIISAAISVPNLLFTGLLVLVLLYWISVILGAVDMDSFDVDVAGPDLDVDVDVDVDVDADMHVEPASLSAVYLRALRFFNFGSIPFMMLMSILILSMWSISIFCNHEGSAINPSNNAWIALVLIVPNLIISLFITKLVTQPLVPFFHNLDTHAKPFEIEGQMGTLLLPIEAQEVGQIKITVNQSVVTLKVRSVDGKPLAKGQEVLVVDKLEQEECYLVQPINTDKA